jgi:hypothetical protein
MKQMWRQMFAAVVGVAAIAAVAAAQSPPPRPLPPIIPVAAPVTSAIPDAMPALGGLAPAGLRADGATTAPPVTAPVSYGMPGPGCNNGCGSCKHDCGFMFGSCRNFFDPCGPKPCGDGGRRGRCGGGLGGICGGKCPTTPFGQPYGTPHSGCRYDSWLNY